jgi:branched-chain amino acid transport system substrate-binding protein
VGGALLVRDKKGGEESRVIKIGAILGLSDSYLTPVAEDEKRAIDMAIEEVNLKGGINGKNVEIVYQDQQGDNPQGAISAYYKLRGEGIGLIIGPDATPAAMALAPLVEKDKVVLFAATVGSEKFAPASEYTFCTWPADLENSIALGKHLYSKGFRKIAVLGSQQEWEKTQAEGVKQGFEDAGGKVVVMELPLPTNLDLRSEALKIKNTNPEVVVFTNYGQIMVGSKRVRDIGVTVPFYSVVFDDSQIAQAQGALEGTISISSISPSPEFTTKFKEKYSKSPQIGADSAYDAVKILFSAIEKAKSIDPIKVKDELAKIKSWDGASGKLTIDEFGGAHKDPQFYIVKGNTIEKYQP